MKLEETLAKMNSEEKSKVVELLRGKAAMHRSLLVSDCEERITKAIPQTEDRAIKAMHMICDAMIRKSKGSSSLTIKAEDQERYHEIAMRITEVIESKE